MSHRALLPSISQPTFFDGDWNCVNPVSVVTTAFGVADALALPVTVTVVVGTGAGLEELGLVVGVSVSDGFSTTRRW
jgi:hypothetical protein